MSRTIALLVIALLVITACSTQKNTAQSRWWHSFNARYNTYYNGAQAYIDASLEKEKGNVDNFTELIPLYTVGNKKSRDLGKSNYDRAIEKSEKAIKQHSIKRRPEWNKRRRKTERDIEWLNRKEYNPFLWKAWMLMGRSQFHKGAFDEAAATFSYMSRLYATQPAIYGRARAWLAKCYIEQDWLYDAEDVIRNIQRDSIDWRATKEWDYTFADYYIHTGEYDKAIPYLKKAIKHEMRRVQKAREYYLLGQLYKQLGQNDNAYKAFKSVIRQHPPYIIEFNARIAMTEVATSGRNAKQMISQLRRMSRSDKNKDYLDQVFYAIGNIYLQQKDTVHAIEAYEKGNEKSTRNGIEKGVLLLRLGDIYWDKEKYNDAQRCYGTAIGLLDKDRKDYQQLSDRSKKLDELVPYTDAIHLQDSLLELAEMSEEDRNKAIDKVIEALKKKEKEELRAQQEADAAQQLQQNSGVGNRNQQAANIANRPGQQDGVWYFYNQMAVVQGKSTFERQWGKRENADDWQRINKTVVGGMNTDEELTQEQLDSIATAEALQDSLETAVDSAQYDPHKREYYIAQIPFTEEQKLASHLIIQDGLFNSGVIFKDKFNNLPLSKKQFARLVADYPEFDKMDEVYYHLFLLYSRLGQHATASNYIDLLKASHTDSQWTKVLTDPYFSDNARFGVQLEDSLYAATYDAFKNDRYSEVATNYYISETRFPLGANRDKFIFISGLSQLNSGDANSCIEKMEQIVKNYPQSRISEMAGMIVNGVREGRRLHGGKFDLGDVWDKRNNVLNAGDSTVANKFVADRNVEHRFMLIYNPDSINENQLLYEMARFNFTNYLVRNFELSIEEIDGICRMSVTGFQSFDEAHLYTRHLYDNKQIVAKLAKTRGLIISEKNLPLLGTTFSYKDYDAFYNKHFAPLIITNPYLLTEPTEIAVEKEKEETVSEENNNEELIENNALIEEDYAIDDSSNSPQTEESTIPAEQQQPTETTIPVTEEAEATQQTNQIEVPQNVTTLQTDETLQTESTEVQTETEPQQEEVTTATETETTITEENIDTETEPLNNQQDDDEEGFVFDDNSSNNQNDDDGFIFDDGTTQNNNATDDDEIIIIDNNSSTTNDDDFDVDDEYFELEGF